MRNWEAGRGKVRDRQSGDRNVGKFGVVRWSRKGEFGKTGVDGQTRCGTAVIRWAEWKVRPKNFGVVEFQVGNSLGRESAGFTGRRNGENRGVGGGILRGNREGVWEGDETEKSGKGVDWVDSAEASGWQEFRKVRLEGKTSASRELGEGSEMAGQGKFTTNWSRRGGSHRAGRCIGGERNGEREEGKSRRWRGVS